MDLGEEEWDMGQDEVDHTTVLTTMDLIMEKECSEAQE